jgi:hypothetical protein
MAGLPWFELDVDAFEHPKVRALQAALKEPLADAYLARLWAYCYRHAKDRFPDETAELVVEEAARWRGKAGALFAAMLKVGALDRDGGEVVVHGVEERLGPHLDHRTKAAARQRKRRSGLVMSQPVPGDVTRDVPSESRPDKDKDRDKDRIASERSTDSPDPARTQRAGGGTRLGPLGAEVRARCAQGLGYSLAPCDQTRANRLEQLVEWFGGVDAAVGYVAATCRKRDVKPESLSLVVDMLADAAGQGVPA